MGAGQSAIDINAASRELLERTVPVDDTAFWSKVTAFVFICLFTQLFSGFSVVDDAQSLAWKRTIVYIRRRCVV
jgi:hypothetical protein